MTNDEELIDVGYAIDFVDYSENQDAFSRDSVNNAAAEFEEKHKLFFEKQFGIQQKHIHDEGHDNGDSLVGTIFLTNTQLNNIIHSNGEWVDSNSYILNEWNEDPSGMLAKLDENTDGNIGLHVEFFNLTEEMVENAEKFVKDANNG